jgi:hypothetical protein
MAKLRDGKIEKLQNGKVGGSPGRQVGSQVEFSDLPTCLPG